MNFKKFSQIVLLSFSIYFLSWFVLYRAGVNTLPIQSEDTLPTIFLPVAIIKEKTLYLDTYYDMMIERYPHPDDKDQTLGLTPFYLKKIGDNYASAFTIITALVSLPVYFLPLEFGMLINWENLIILSKISSALIMGLSGGFFYLLLKKQFSLDEKKANVLTTIYLFATVNFAMLSQSMWQHGTLQLFSILGLYFILDFLKQPKFKPSSAFWGGFFYGLAILSRPTSALALVFILLLMLIKIRNLGNYIKANIFTMLGLLVNVLFFLWYNNKYYIGIENQGYTSQLLGSWISPFPISFLGVWLSPSKGILTYSPIFIFSFVGLRVAMKKGKREHAQYLIYFLIVLFHTLIISFWKHWYGGYSFGYRMSSDIIPYLVLLIIPFINSPLYQKNYFWFWLSIYFSIFMQVMGIVFFDSIWHAAYDTG
ncbi:glycosyltransferase family 39 protein, partial [Patescibacteria group bacterium]|nr:glycosyltransferase family 39 protein [Patescibacteria group bacterium]